MTGEELIELARLERRHARELEDGRRKRSKLSAEILVELGALLSISLAVAAIAIAVVIATH